jgi:transcription factor S
MKLCKDCGNLMVPSRQGNQVMLTCQHCNTKAKVEKGSSFKLTEKIEHDNKDVIAVVEQNVSNLPITEINCPECHHNKAHWWTKQTRASDEPETRFYRCTNCKKTWREYS